MYRVRFIFAVVLGGLVFPIIVFFLGASLYDGHDSRITNALWAPPLAIQSMFEASCTRPLSESFACPYGQGAHNRLFLASFFLAYFPIGVAVTGLAFKLLVRQKRAAHV